MRVPIEMIAASGIFRNHAESIREILSLRSNYSIEHLLKSSPDTINVTKPNFLTEALTEASSVANSVPSISESIPESIPDMSDVSDVYIEEASEFIDALEAVLSILVGG